MSLYPNNLCTLAVSFLYGEYVVRFPSGWCILVFDCELDFDIILCENSAISIKPPIPDRSEPGMDYLRHTLQNMLHVGNDYLVSRSPPLFSKTMESSWRYARPQH